MRTRRPTGDDVLLIDRALLIEDAPTCDQMWTTALGPPPSLFKIASWVSQGNAPREVRHSVAWTRLLPERSVRAWVPTAAAIESVYGPTSRSSLERARRVESRWVGSPMEAEELARLAPLTAATRIAEWQPEPGSFLHGARQLAHTLGDVMASDTAAWLREPSVIVTALREPTYIVAYLRAATTAIKQGVKIDAAAVMDAMALVRSRPWLRERLSAPETWDHDGWSDVEELTLEVLGALATSKQGFAGRDAEAWAAIAAGVRGRDEASAIVSGAHDALEMALNRPCTQALEAALSYISFRFSERGVVDEACLTILDEVLALEGDDGLQHRAVLVTRLAFLRHVAPDWFARSAPRLFGEAAPEGLAQGGADLALAWGQPNRWLMENHRELILYAARRGVQHSVEHLLVRCCGRSAATSRRRSPPKRRPVQRSRPPHLTPSGIS